MPHGRVRASSCQAGRLARLDPPPGGSKKICKQQACCLQNLISDFKLSQTHSAPVTPALQRTCPDGRCQETQCGAHLPWRAVPGSVASGTSAPVSHKKFPVKIAWEDPRRTETSSRRSVRRRQRARARHAESLALIAQ
jgi:hypothetical protein